MANSAQTSDFSVDRSCGRGHYRSHYSLHEMKQEQTVAILGGIMGVLSFYTESPNLSSFNDRVLP